MHFVSVPAGTFTMGSPPDERRRGQDELLHRVTLTRGFALSAHLVTQEQWQRVMGANPSKFPAQDDAEKQALPVDSVSWQDAAEFCRRLSDLPEEQEAGRVYRLPTEAEWEYACRADTTTPYWTGAVLATDEANYARERKSAPRGKPTAVDAFRANPWGLHDMHGNLWQWCADWYGPYPDGAVTDPQGPPYGGGRVLRGGSWASPPERCRAAARGQRPDARPDQVGLRVVCERRTRDGPSP
jgi:formylglycine-generating enzyme required for sulfatase activity